jgi:hypothetical protein
MDRFFEILKTLFPRSRAFSLFIENGARGFIEALSVPFEKVREEAEKAYLDLFPESTRVPELWEKDFALFFTSAEYSKRRPVIGSLWGAMAGGQSARFLQDMLGFIDARIRVIENAPISNPRHSSIVDLCVNGNSRMRCGNSKAVCNYRRGEIGFLPTVIQNDATAPYAIPFNPDYWATCFYVCAGDGRILYARPFTLEAVWRNYVEYLILRTKPVHATAIVFIKWV